MSTVSVETASQDLEGAERRRSYRASLIVRIDYSTVDELFSEFTSDINEGGLFIETEKPQPAGTEVALHFNLPGSDRIVKTCGMVVRVSDGKDGSTPGMGIEFEDLPSDARVHINHLIRTLRSTSEPVRPRR